MADRDAVEQALERQVPAPPARRVSEADLRPCAYVRQGKRLYEVMSVEDERVRLENCATGFAISTEREIVLGPTYALVKAAPAPPDSLPGEG